MSRKGSNISRRISKTSSKNSPLDLTDLKAGEDDHLSFIADIRKPPLEEYQTLATGNQKLFKKVYTMVDNKMLEADSQDSAILVSSFGMRNVSSLENALKNKQRRKFLEAYQSISEAEEEEGGEVRTISTVSTTTTSRTSEKISTETETETESLSSATSGNKRQLEYLMGLTTVEEEQIDVVEVKQDVPQAEFKYSTSASMMKAQKYLRYHRIFDFFQFIITHLLGKQPENPIEFIIKLLNKCLLYRSGLGSPPLLYTEKHIEQLFNLMDRMNTGFVDMVQYNQGMKTLGICEYDKSPPVSADGLVEKSVFVDKVYEAEQALFDDLIKRKWIGQKPPPGIEKPIGYRISLKDMSGPFFIPSDLFDNNRKSSSLDEFSDG